MSDQVCWRRPNRAREDDSVTIRAAIRPGFTRPQKARDVLDVIEMHPQWALLTKRGREGLKTTLQAMVDVTDYDTMTTRPTWAYLEHQSQRKRRTIAYRLAILREWGILGVVATGRSAAYAAKGPDGKTQNEAAVYVLCVPMRYARCRLPRKLPTRLAPAPAVAPRRVIHSQSVEKNCTPPAVGGLGSLRERFTHARAREEHLLAETATRSAVYSGGRWAAAQARYPHYRPVIVWPGERRAANKREREAAAVELRRRLMNIFRGMSVPDLAAAIRDFLIAGWTVRDLIHGIERRPDGSPWPYSGTPSTTEARQVRGWLKFRLAAWRHSSAEPLPSPSTRRQAETARRKAQQRREWEEAQQRRTQRAAPDSPTKAAALARMRKSLNR